jgi:hypothetical protein
MSSCLLYLYLPNKQGAEDFAISGLHLRVTSASASARAAIEKLGGQVETVYYNRLGLRAHLRPEKFDILPLNAAPPPRHAGRYDTPQPFPAAPKRAQRLPVGASSASAGATASSSSAQKAAAAPVAAAPAVAATATA